MNLLYKSTRDAEKTVTASQAILKGLADDGGLFVPQQIPHLDVTMEQLAGMSYLYRFRFRSFRCRLVNSKR